MSVVMSSVSWQDLGRALRDLHRVLVVRERRTAENARGALFEPGELLQRLTSDPKFEWLRELSALMADIDAASEAGSAAKATLESTVRGAIEQLVSAPGETGRFAAHYWPHVHDDPEVALAHAELKRTLASWPRPAAEDTAGPLRHRLAEQAGIWQGRTAGGGGRTSAVKAPDAAPTLTEGT